MKCKKLIYADEFNERGLPTRTKYLLGVILDDTDADFLEFRTRKCLQRINKKFIVSIRDTDLDFEWGEV